MKRSEHDRPFLKALIFEKDGDLNLSQLLTAMMAIVGMVGFGYVIFHNSTPVVQIAAWSFLAGAFASVLIASLPIAKAKILAHATLPGELAKSVASVGDTFVEQSTDVQEGFENNNLQSKDIG